MLKSWAYQLENFLKSSLYDGDVEPRILKILMVKTDIFCLIKQTNMFVLSSTIFFPLRFATTKFNSLPLLRCISAYLTHWGSKKRRRRSYCYDQRWYRWRIHQLDLRQWKPGSKFYRPGCLKKWKKGRDIQITKAPGHLDHQWSSGEKVDYQLSNYLKTQEIINSLL